MPSNTKFTVISISAFFNNPCPPRYSIVFETNTGYCVHQQSQEPTTLYYGSHFTRYRVGATANQTLYMMSRAQVSQTLKYTCDYWNAFVLTYNNVYYCYTYISWNMVSNNYLPISNNYCLTYMANSWPITLFHELIAGMLFSKD